MSEKSWTLVEERNRIKTMEITPLNKPSLTEHGLPMWRWMRKLLLELEIFGQFIRLLRSWSAHANKLCSQFLVQTVSCCHLTKSKCTGGGNILLLCSTMLWWIAAIPLVHLSPNRNFV